MRHNILFVFCRKEKRVNNFFLIIFFSSNISFDFHFRYWAVEVVAEGEEPIGDYTGAEDDDNPTKSPESQQFSTQMPESQ